VRLAEVTDGTSNTLLFGERSHTDRNYDTFAAAGAASRPAMAFWGWWGVSEGRLAVGDVTLSAFVPINYLIPPPPAPGAAGRSSRWRNCGCVPSAATTRAGPTSRRRTARCGSSRIRPR